MGSAAVRLLLISQVLPGETSAGGIVLQRHLSDPELIHHVAQPSSRLGERWGRTRLAPFFNDLAEMIPIRATPADRQLARAFKPDAILTVASGVEYRRALGLARATGLPLISIFHDLWPEVPDLSVRGRKCAWNAFRALAHESSIALAVSEEMLSAIGCPDGGRVLLPIPSHSIGSTAAPQGLPLRVGYSGNLFTYAEPVGALAEMSLAANDIELVVRGNAPDWDPERLARLRAAGVYHESLDRTAYEAWAASLDVHLCVLSFDSALSSRMRTSFPSKMIEALRFEKPVILWGPEGTSGVRWASETGAALTVTDKDPAAVIAALRRLAGDRELYAQYASGAQRCARAFSFDRLQAQFRFHLAEALAGAGRPLHKAKKPEASSAN